MKANEMNAKNPIPFELFLTVQEGKTKKELFVQTVEQVLQEELHSPNSFGCKISRCHTHVGSKKHLGFFVEAELLFHNSYYNKGFAFLTAKRILEYINEPENNRFDRICLIGYETFSELFLCETRDLLNEYKPTDYCVFETTGQKRSHLRGLKRIADNNTEYIKQGRMLYVFIVPISTTLTTHDKLISSFEDGMEHFIKENLGSNFTQNKSVNFGLVVIGDSENSEPYWRIDQESRKLQPSNGRQDGEPLFQKLKQDVFYFAHVTSKWSEANECEHCFPDIAKRAGTLTNEQPIFEVNRASVVPMLQLRADIVPAPREHTWNQQEAQDNIARVIRLSQYMYHQHLVRNSNHFQYYFDTEAFLQSEKEKVRDWLENVVKKRLEETGKKTVFNIIVAPRHSSNADFLHTVNNKVFKGSARIFHFDVQREFRGNIEAKYSDFAYFVKNIMSFNDAFEIRYHYVDDCINMGQNFARTKSLINSLHGTINSSNVFLFYSVIILLGRNSTGTKQNWISNLDNFYEYVHLAVSPMRSHDDACTLCQMVQNFNLIEENCATNEMSRLCLETIREHNVGTIDDKTYQYAQTEKRLRIILSHIIKERITNNWSVRQGAENKPESLVRSQCTDDIYNALEILYKDIQKKKGIVSQLYIDNNASGTPYSALEAQTAFIKVISRPFFTYGIRQKQASFRFCLESLEKELESKTPDKRLLSVLICALADMDANYLLRALIMKKLFCLKCFKENIELRKFYLRSIKKITTLSKNPSKSLLLESILVTGSENAFFERTCNSETTVTFEPLIWLCLYMENTRLIRDGFEDIYRKREYDVLTNTPYFLKQFAQLFKLNKINGADAKDVIKTYCSLKKELKPQSKNKASEYFESICSHVSSLLQIAEDKSLLFIRSRNNDTIVNTLLCGNDKAHMDFFTPAFQWALNELIDDGNGNYVGETLFFKKDLPFFIVKFEAVILPIDNDSQLREDKDSEKTKRATEHAVYFYVPLLGNNSMEPIFNEFFSPDKASERFLQFMFRIKLLLSLRSEFVQMLKMYFATDAIQQLVLENERTLALSISKASNHGIAQYYSSIKCDEILRHISDENYKTLIDHYIQMLSNNFIAAQYRDVSKKYLQNSDITCENNKVDVGYDVINTQNSAHQSMMYELLLQNYNAEKETYQYSMSAPSKNGEGGAVEAKLTINLRIKKGDKWILKYISRNELAVGPTLLIVILLAANARYHTPSTIECVEVEVCKDGAYLCVRNRVENAENTADRVNELIQCPPHRLAHKSITLWTLNKYCGLINEQSDKNEPNNESAFIIEALPQNVFQVKLRLFD